MRFTNVLDEEIRSLAPCPSFLISYHSSLPTKIEQWGNKWRCNRNRKIERWGWHELLPTNTSLLSKSRLSKPNKLKISICVLGECDNSLINESRKQIPWLYVEPWFVIHHHMNMSPNIKNVNIVSLLINSGCDDEWNFRIVIWRIITTPSWWEIFYQKIMRELSNPLFILFALFKRHLWSLWYVYVR